MEFDGVDSTIEAPKAPKDDGRLSPDSDRAKNVRKFWFNGLDSDGQDAVIKPAFESQHPTDVDKRKATKKFDSAVKSETTIVISNGGLEFYHPPVSLTDIDTD